MYIFTQRIYTHLLVHLAIYIYIYYIKIYVNTKRIPMKHSTYNIHVFVSIEDFRPQCTASKTGWIWDAFQGPFPTLPWHGPWNSYQQRSEPSAGKNSSWQVSRCAWYFRCDWYIYDIQLHMQSRFKRIGLKVLHEMYWGITLLGLAGLQKCTQAQNRHNARTNLVKRLFLTEPLLSNYIDI